MPAIERILFPVDFSPQCEGAASFVQSMAALHDAQVTLLHAIDAGHYLFAAGEAGGVTSADFYDSQRARSKQQLDTFLLREFPRARRELCEGEVGARISGFANSNDIDLIMMPTHGLGPFRRFLIGSITAKVLHDAHCPVWTGIHMEDAPPQEAAAAKSIGCAVDLGAESDAALRWAADFAASADGVVTILHAVPAVESRPAKYFDTEFRTALRHQAQFELERLRDRVHAEAEILIVDGEPAKAIRHAALGRNVDLLVIGRGSAADGFGRLRKNAYDIIRNAPCPTVSV